MMFKRICCLLMCLLLPFAALAEPRYPAQAGATTDRAAVLSHETLEDLRTLDSRLKAADALRIRIVTVDFLDAQDVQVYADTLFTRWNLSDDELLLLMAVGEDAYAIAAGANVDRLLAPATQSKLVSAYFVGPFLNQRYEEAIAAFVPALVREINKVCGTNVSTDGLFTRHAESLIVNWASTLSDDAAANSETVTVGKSDNAFLSWLAVIAIVAVLLVVFSPKRSKKKAATPQYFKKKKPGGAPTPQYFKPRKH